MTFKILTILLLLFLVVLTSCGPSNNQVSTSEPAPALTSPGLPQSPVQGQFSITGLVIPCGLKSGIPNQTLLQLANGQILGSVPGQNWFEPSYLAILPTGTYKTLDQKHCKFTVNSDGSVTW